MSASQSAMRLMGCLLGGALGDALGAPAEGMRSLKDVLVQFGPEGVDRMHPYGGYHDEAIKHTGIGAITDDTTMHAATLGGMLMALRQPDKLNAYCWQGYVRWASHQNDGLKVLPHVNIGIDWPAELQPFFFACGAGRGTIAALATGKMGRVEQPLGYDTEIRGRRVVGPNEGCGGMMRAAALAFWPHAKDKFRLGMENGAITHGARNAYLATGCITELTAGVLDELSLRDAFSRMSMRLRVEDKNDVIVAATEHGWERGRVSTSFNAIDRLPADLGYKNPFLAGPVLAQSVYVLSAYHHHGVTFKEALTLAATHSGDSDSVAAIVGNVLGAKEGAAALPQDWLGQIQKRPELEALGLLASRRLSL